MRDARGRRVVLLTALAFAAALTGCTASGAHSRPVAAPSSRRTSGSRRAPAQGTAPAAPLPARVHRVRIPGGPSRFAARPALVYLPPDARPGARLPVLELLHGLPGQPSDWVTRGDLQPTLDAFARAHGGRAPIVVLPDINGAQRVDTECVRTPAGADVERYLTGVVPRWITAHLPATRDHRRWASAGLSEGGTCAITLALRHRREFAAFADLSGLARPTVSDRDDPRRTVRVLFGGSTTAYDRHDPLWLLSHRRYPGLSGWLACGALDRSVRLDQDALAGLARRARITITEDVLPGGHSWQVWRTELRRLLPWLWRLVG